MDKKNIIIIAIVAIFSMISNLTEGMLSEVCAMMALVIVVASIPGIVEYTLLHWNDEEDEEPTWGKEKE